MCGMVRLFFNVSLSRNHQNTRLGSGRRVGSCCMSEQEMVGTTGFEPATSRTPSVRATRLRYVPTGKLTTMRRNPEDRIAPATATSRLSPPFEQRQESAQRIAQIEQHFAAQQLRRALTRVVRARAFGLIVSFMLAQKAASASDGEAFVVEQPLDAEDHVHVILAVEAMAAGTFDGLEHGELGFPITQHERL